MRKTGQKEEKRASGIKIDSPMGAQLQFVQICVFTVSIDDIVETCHL
jgi:hypothetical protein